MEDLNSVEVVEALVLEIEKKLKIGAVKEAESDLLPKLRTSISKLPVLNRQDMFTLRKSAYDFWNLAVEMGQKKVTAGDLNPKMRQIACNMLTLSAATDDVDPETIQTILKFFARTGKSWSELGNYPLAENCWNNALEYWDTIKEKKQFNEMELAAVKQHLFTLFCWRSEAAWERNLRELSFELAMKASNEASEVNQWTYLSVIGYNFGVQLHHDESFDEAAKWLERSVEWLEKDAHKDASKQARTLRLLCNCYISRGNFEKASRCVEIANMEESTCAGLYLLLKIRMLQKQDSATILLFELLNHADCNFELASAALKMAIDNKWEETIGRVFQYLNNKFANTNLIEKLKFLEFEYYLVNANNFDAAMSTLENVIAAHNLGHAKLSTQTLCQFHFLIWNTAIGYFKQSEFQRAIDWLVRCNRLLGPEDGENRAQCLRILSRCYLSLQDAERSLEYALQAEVIEPKSPTGLLLLFELFLRLDKEKELVDLLGRISKVLDQPQKFLELCSQKSMEKGRRTTASHVLEHLMHNPFSSEFDGHFALIARTLIQLYLKEDEANYSKLIDVMKITLSKVKESGAKTVFGGDKEITWLSSTAWNLGYQMAKKDDYESTYQFLAISYELLNLIDKTPEVLTMQRTCLLVNVQALIDLEKQTKGITNNQRAQLALQLVNEIRGINEKIKTDKMELEGQSEEDGITALLMQFEFELHVLLGDDVPQKIIGQTKSMSNIPASFFVLLSGIVANHPHYTQCATESLKIAYDIQLREKDYQQACTVLRSVIKLTKDRDQSLKMFLDGLDIVTKYATDTPQFMNEVKWLLASAYNNGVYFWRLNRYEQAEKWLGLAVKFLNCLNPPEKSCFETEVMNSYSTVLTKVK